MPLTIDFVIETSLVAIYSKDLFSDKLYLKGGQALRIKENLTNRFSADMDFSVETNITSDDAFFELMNSTLVSAFYENGYFLFDFKPVRRPRHKREGAPDFWSGWGVEFKLIENAKRNMEKNIMSREALIPKGSNSPKITIDISEYEYCGSVEKVKLQSADIDVYSRTLILVEKIRAICQQHPDYPHKHPEQRSRDYYDIERLWNKVLGEKNPEEFLADCAKHLPNVFGAKEVDLALLDKIFDQEFVDNQRSSWTAIEATVSGKLENFNYYNDSLKLIVRDIKLTMQLTK